jgi:hypothetical protein
MKRRYPWLSSSAVACIALLGLGYASAAEAAGAATATNPVADDSASTLRLSPSQYRETIADVFDASININGRFEPEQRDQGMLAVGARTENFTDSGFEGYYRIARGIAGQVVDPRHRATLIGCKPRSEAGRDDQCAQAFFGRVAPLLYRRPVGNDEVQHQVAAAGMAADQLHDFYSGIRLSLTEMLISPRFLLRYRTMEPVPDRAGQERMDAYDKAAQLSFFLWNTTPDPELMKAAQAGQLNSQAGLEQQVNRLLHSPRVVDGVRGLFADMLSFSDFESVSKDPAFFPRYTPSIKEQAQEQTLRTIVDHVTHHGDYRDLFTTPRTFLTMDLAALYDVPIVDRTDNGQPQRWIPYTYPEGNIRAGILSQASFTTLWSPSARTSATERGKALREHVLCERVPPPPGNVEFKFVDDTSNPKFRTTRERLLAHQSSPVCAGCHKLTDPIGLSLENFTAGGEFRTSENGATIDARGELNGQPFVGPQGLAKAVHDDPAAVSCVAQRAFSFATGYTPPKDDDRWHQIEQKFAASHYDVMELLRAIAVSDLTYSRLAQ